MADEVKVLTDVSDRHSLSLSPFSLRELSIRLAEVLYSGYDMNIWHHFIRYCIKEKV